MNKAIAANWPIDKRVAYKKIFKNDTNHFLKNPHPRICLFSLISERKGERDRERKRHYCERETLIGCLPYAPQLGIEPATSAFQDDAPTTWATLPGHQSLLTLRKMCILCSSLKRGRALTRPISGQCPRESRQLWALRKRNWLPIDVRMYAVHVSISSKWNFEILNIYCGY